MTADAIVAAIPNLLDGIAPHFRNSGEARDWLGICGETLVDSDVAAFAMLLEQPGFRRFLAQRGRSSRGRLSALTGRLLLLLVRHTRPDLVAAVAAVVAGSAYRLIERSFFVVPVDEAACRAFDRCTIEIGATDIGMIDPWLSFVGSQEFALCRQAQSGDLVEELMQRFATTVLGLRDATQPIAMAALFATDPWPALFSDLRSPELRIAEPHDADRFFNQVFGDCSGIPNIPDLTAAVRLWQPYINGTCTARVAGWQTVWPVLIILREPADRSVFRDFLRLYARRKDVLCTTIWDGVFDIAAGRGATILRAMTVFTTTSFQSLVQSFRHKLDILLMVISNIMVIVAEHDVRSLPSSVSDIVVKLLVHLRVEEAFLERRATFVRWLVDETRSDRIQNEFIRILLFEYIFMATKIVPTTRPQVMSKTISNDHALFVAVLDGPVAKYPRPKLVDLQRLFGRILTAIRATIWRPIEDRFPEQVFLVQEIQSASVSISGEDQAIEALETIDPAHLEPYHANFLEAFRHDPKTSLPALAGNHWCRITLLEAMPAISAVLLPIVGMVPVVADTANEPPGLAYTDGSTITLMQYLANFADPKQPLQRNRNLSFFLAMALHESGHIIGGSFSVDLSLFMSKLERPELFRYILNVFEDFRIEAFLVECRLFPATDQLFQSANEWLSVRNFVAARDQVTVREHGVVEFLGYIFDESAGCNTLLKSDVSYRQFVDELLAQDLPAGRFGSLRALVDYGVNRLTHLDIFSPVAAIWLSYEFYEILRWWSGRLFSESSAYGPFRAPNNAGAGWVPKVHPLNAAELKELYDQYNRDPQRFLTDLHLSTAAEAQRRQAVVDGYSQEGIADRTTRTRVDDLMALVQIRSRQLDADADARSTDAATAQPKTMGVTHVYTLDPKTRSRTRLAEIRTFAVTAVDRAWLRRFNRTWGGIIQRVEQLLADIIQPVEVVEESAVEGDIEIERLIEILSSANPVGGQSFLESLNDDVRHDDMAVVIGLDTSGSTAGDILDIEKAFAIIFGRALATLTNEIHFLAFNSATSTNVYIAKTIDAISSLKADQANRDGDFIRYVTNVLRPSAAALKLFVLISDGMPISDNYYGKDAMDDTVLAMRECSAAGIRLIYLNVDTRRGEYFDVFKHEAGWAEHFSRAEDLLPRIPDLVRSIVALRS